MKHIILLILLTLGAWAQGITTPNDQIQDSLKITRLAMMEKNNLLIAGDNNGIIHFLTLDPLKEIKSFRAHDTEITQIVFPENEQFFFTTAKDKTIKQWDTKTLKLTHTYDGHKNIVSHIDVTSDGSVLVSLDMNLTALTWNVLDKRNDKQIDFYHLEQQCVSEMGALSKCYPFYIDSDSDLGRVVKISNDGKKLIITGERLVLFDLNKMQLITSYYPSKHGVFTDVLKSKKTHNIYAIDQRALMILDPINMQFSTKKFRIANDIAFNEEESALIGIKYMNDEKLAICRFSIENNTKYDDILYKDNEISSNLLLHDKQIIFAKSNSIEFISFETGTFLKSILINTQKNTKQKGK